MTARIAGRSTAGKNFHLLPSPLSPHAVTAIVTAGEQSATAHGKKTQKDYKSVDSVQRSESVSHLGQLIMTCHLA